MRFRRSSRVDESASYAVVCVRTLLDARANTYLQRHAHIATLPPSSAKLREAASLLRQLRGAWIAAGSQSLERVSERQMRELLERWQAPIPDDPAGEGMLATLVVRSSTTLLIEGRADDVDDVRSELEALSSVYVEDVLEADLHCDGRRIRVADALALARDPPLHEAGAHARTFCASCGLWLGPVADYTGRCVDCATRLAA